MMPNTPSRSATRSHASQRHYQEVSMIATEIKIGQLGINYIVYAMTH